MHCEGHLLRLGGQDQLDAGSAVNALGEFRHAGDHGDFHPVLFGQSRHTGDDLAMQRLLIEPALTGNHPGGAAERGL